MRSGALRDRVNVERNSPVSDGYGNTVGGWGTLYAGVPASVLPMKGGEVVRMSRVESSGAVEIWMRSSSETRSITPSDRLINSATGAIYEIRHIADLTGRNRDLLFTCEETK